MAFLDAKPFQFCDSTLLVPVGENEGEIQGLNRSPGTSVVEAAKHLDWADALAADVIEGYGSAYF